MEPSMDKMHELQTVISKMPLHMCRTLVLPEFSVRWSEVSRAVRNARMPMVPVSVARVLCRHAMKTLPKDEVEEILAVLRLKLLPIQSRNWHVINLLEPTTHEPFSVLIRTLPHRIKQALKKGKIKNMVPQVQSLMHDDLLYISIQLVSDSKESSVLYVATPPGQPVALVTAMPGILKYVVQGLGYEEFKNANLHGRDIPSLLRISDPAWNANVDHLTDVPEYNPLPVLLKDGIDFTNKKYDEDYVDKIIGPNPPILTELKIETSMSLFDRSRLSKPLKMTVTLKSDNVAKSLKDWALKGALAPTSELFKIYKNKSNRIVYDSE